MCLDNFSGAGGGAAGGGGGGGATSKLKPFTVFLFEQIMIFSEVVGKKTQFTSPVYLYKAHFLVRECLSRRSLDQRDFLRVSESLLFVPSSHAQSVDL